MNDYRERLEASGYLAAFEQARAFKDLDAMRRVLEIAKFAPPEIESILWSNGENVAHALTPDEKKKQLRDAIVGRVGIAVLSGLILGGSFVYASIGLDESPRGRKFETAMRDYRSPKDAYYRPFLLGFTVGAVAGLIAGPFIIDGLLERKKDT
jgi:hypothetical protein